MFLLLIFGFSLFSTSFSFFFHLFACLCVEHVCVCVPLCFCFPPSISPFFFGVPLLHLIRSHTERDDPFSQDFSLCFSPININLQPFACIISSFNLFCLYFFLPSVLSPSTISCVRKKNKK